nr:hypothetical protein [Tanacetum cinerariifolium]
PLNSEDEETPLTSPVIPDADGQPIPPIASFGQNFHCGERSSTANLLTGNSKIVPTSPMCPNLGTAWKRLRKMEKLMSKRIDTERRMKKKFNKQDRYFVGLGCDNIEMDRVMRNVMSDLFGLKKLVKDLSDRFDEYEGSKVFEDKKVLEKELVNERNEKEFYQEFGEQYDAIAAAAVATSRINDDDDTAPMDSHPYEPPRSPHFMKCTPITFRGNEGAVGLIRWIEETKMVFTVSKCTEANKVVFAAVTFQDRALTWRTSREAVVVVVEIAIVTGTTTTTPATIGHKARDCWSKVVATGANAQPVVTCYECGEKGHIKTNCPARNNPGRSGARGQAYALRDGDQNLGPNVGRHLIDIETVKVDHSYEVELADGRVVSTNTILRGCALNFINHLFEIDLMPIELSTFDLIIRMDWLILYDSVIVCGKKEVHVPLKKRTLVVKVIEKEPAERCLEDMPVICKFPDVFPENLPGLPPPRQWSSKLNWFPEPLLWRVRLID